MYRVAIKRNSPNFTVIKVRHEVKIQRVNKVIKLELAKARKVVVKRYNRVVQVVSRGKRGLRGEPGLGLPPGGAPGQTLIKQSTSDYDTIWSSISGSDKNYFQNFTSTDDVLVNHNLAKYPAVSVLDSAGSEVIGEVEYISINSLRVLFSAPFSGSITVN